jgi:hypothetical protein
MKSKITFFLFIYLFVNFTFCQSSVADAEIKRIAKEAFIYGLPVVENYRVMYKSTHDRTFPQYAPFNTFYHAKNVATAKDTIFVAPNVDTPYSYAVLDVKEQPVVMTIPKVEKNRFIGVPFYDLYTHVIYTISPKNYIPKGGKFLITNSNWKGKTPKGITKVIVSETDLIYVLIRTQLFSKSDVNNVNKIQSQMKLETLSDYLGKKNSEPIAATKWIEPITNQSPYSEPNIEFFRVLNFALQFCSPHSSEKKLWNDFAKIGIVPGEQFSVQDSHTKELLLEGIKEAQKEMLEYLPKIKSSSEIFGSREYLKNNYKGRAVGAWTGIYANEADVFLGINGFERQSDGKPFDGKNNYSITFAKDDFPPVDAFWSITMYKLPSRFLYDNPLNRYCINSPMQGNLKKNKDGSVTIYIQHESPGKDLESNWLPCPKSLFFMACRCYMPKETLKNGTWKSPEVLLTK